jgi:hypothetical protein
MFEHLFPPTQEMHPTVHSVCSPPTWFKGFQPLRTLEHFSSVAQSVALSQDPGGGVFHLSPLRPTAASLLLAPPVSQTHLFTPR